MVGFITTSALAVLLGLQQAAASGWGRGGHGGWNQAPPFQCPGNPSQPAPVCSEDQADGWDFSDLTYGESCNSYDNMPFSSGWTYAAGLFSQGSSFRGRGLDMFKRGQHGEGCLVNDLARSPGYNCDQRRGGMNIGHISVVAEREVDVEVIFLQRSGSYCSQFAHCGPNGNTIVNSQCNDAVSVQFRHRSGQSGSCGFGISSISYASCTSTTTLPPTTVPYTAPPTTTPTTTASTTASTTPSTTPSTTASTTTPYIDTSVTTVSSVVTTSSVSTVIITTASTVISCDSTVTNCPASSTVVSTYLTTSTIMVPPPVSTYTALTTSTVPVVTTLYSTVLTTICPVTATQTTGNSTVYSTFLTTSYIPTTIVSTAYATVTVSTVSTVSAISYVSPPPAQSSTPSGGSGCPDTVPQCLASYMWMIPQCKDNTDSSCFCKVAGYTEQIIGCLEAYSGEDLSSAITYFQRICAPYASQNPQPFTGVPTTITITATAPMTTITVQQPGTTATVTLPATTFQIPTGPQVSTIAPPPAAPTATVINTPPPAAPTSVAVGTNSFSIVQASASTSPIAIATGAASKDFVSAGAIGFGAMVAAILAF